MNPLKLKTCVRKRMILRCLALLLIHIFFYNTVDAFGASSTIKVGIYNNDPLIFYDQDGKGKGIFADVMEHVASKERWQIQYVAGTWQQGLSRLASNQIDILTTIHIVDFVVGTHDRPWLLFAACDNMFKRG